MVKKNMKKTKKKKKNMTKKKTSVKKKEDKKRSRKMVSRFRECSTLCRVVKTVHVTNIDYIP